MAYKIPVKKSYTSGELFGGAPSDIKDIFDIKKEKEKEKTFAVENKKKEQKKAYLEEIRGRGIITEKEILLVKRRLNDGTYTSDDVKDFYDLKIMPEQSEKGLKWLKNQGWGITGKERKNIPYGYREESVLKTSPEIIFRSFENISNYPDFKNYVPLYAVKGKEGSFEYYVQDGEIKITG